ncbi:MAG: HNH endonuclease [Terriglobales bacterium]|jgi:HNH endonuclease
MDSPVNVSSAEKLVARLRHLRRKRRKQHEKHRTGGSPRNAPRGEARKKVLKQTARRCHICGGLIAKRWQADHVLAHSRGGPNSPENYLPAHRLCNRYRSDFSSEEFQWILKMGVWSRTMMQKSFPNGGLGWKMAKSFCRDKK